MYSSWKKRDNGSKNQRNVSKNKWNDTKDKYLYHNYIAQVCILCVWHGCTPNTVGFKPPLVFSLSPLTKSNGVYDVLSLLMLLLFHPLFSHYPTEGFENEVTSNGTSLSLLLLHGLNFLPQFLKGEKKPEARLFPLMALIHGTLFKTIEHVMNDTLFLSLSWHQTRSSYYIVETISCITKVHEIKPVQCRCSDISVLDI